MLTSSLAVAGQGMGYGSDRPFYSDMSQMRYAEFLLKDKDYLVAAKEFGRLIEHFPASQLIPEAQLKIADSYLLARLFKEARDEYARFITNFPDNPLIVIAELKRAGAERGEVIVVESFFAGMTEEKATAPVEKVAEAEPEVVEEVPAPEVAEAEPEVVEEVQAPEVAEAEPEVIEEAEPQVAEAEPIVEEAPAVEVVEAAPETIEEAELLPVPLAPAAPDGPDGPIRAAQVMLFEELKDYDAIADELRTLKARGVDTIIVRAFHNTGDRLYPHVSDATLPPGGQGFYFETDHAPVVVDILTDLIPLAHREGIRVFAWMTTRYANYGIEDRPEYACTAYDFTSDGLTRCKGLDLFNEDVVERLMDIYRDLAKYPIDGVLFQDDLVLRHNEGYGEHAAAAYFNDTGNRLNPDSFYIPRISRRGVDYTEEFWEWAVWKNRRLLGVAERLKNVVKKERPDTLFAVNFMYEAVTNPGAGLAWLSQDLREARRVGFDYYSIMAYHRQMGEELGKDPAEISKLITTLVEDAIETIGDPEKVLIKLQSIDWHTREKVPIEELEDLARKVRDVGGVSLAVVPYRQDFSYHVLDPADMASVNRGGF